MEKTLIPGNKFFIFYGFLIVTISVAAVFGTWKSKNDAEYKKYEKQISIYEEKLQEENFLALNGRVDKVEK